MSQLIYLRQRIKAVETIQKTTNAMRLISISTHARLKQQKAHVELYQKEVQKLSHFAYHKRHKDFKIKTLVLIIGSQKGLCGVFNSNLINFFKHDFLTTVHADIFVIGKQACEYAKVAVPHKIKFFPEFSMTNFVDLARTLTQTILATYSHVYVYSNQPKTFFIQKPHKTIVMPHAEKSSEKSTLLEYNFAEQTPQEFSAYIQELIVQVSLQNIMFESLIAEQAARFISMDSATRNAEDFLKIMKLDYNKLRQALITKELTDLTAAL